jgi:hypothetical protein
MAQADPRNIQPAGGTGQVATLQDEAYQLGYQSGYYDHQGNVRTPSAFTAQMMEKLFHCRLPETKEEYDEFFEMLPTIIAALPRITNINAEEFNELIRDWEDIKDLAASEGAERVVQSDIIKMIYKLRLLPARGDFPLPGLTAVSAIITTKQQSEQTVKMPQVQEKGGGWFGFMRR